MREIADPGTGHGRRFYELLSTWLADFARAKGLPAPRALDREGWLRALEGPALGLALRRAVPGEPAWASDFRKRALALPEPTWAQVDRLGDEVRAAAFPAFRRDLLFEMRQARNKAASDFGVESN